MTGGALDDRWHLWVFGPDERLEHLLALIFRSTGSISGPLSDQDNFWPTFFDQRVGFQAVERIEDFLTGNWRAMGLRGTEKNRSVLYGDRALR